MINSISNLLSKKDIYHKLVNGEIHTRRTKIKIPIFNKDLAYLTGVIVGDGSMVITNRKRGGHHYVLSIFSNSRKYLEYLNGLFIQYFNHKCTFYKDKRHDVYTLLVQSAPIFFYFVNINLPVGKSEEEYVPDIIKTKTSYFKEYVAGLCDTDGHVYSSNRIHLKQKSKNLLLEIAEFLNHKKVRCSYPKVNYTNGKPYYYILMDYKLPLRLKMPL
jgi:hypothetical protein